MKQHYYFGLSEEGFHKVAYLEWGNPSELSDPIICVHGFTRQAHDFDALANYLSNRGRHVFCPDMVGRGNSDWLQNPMHYTYEQYCADMTTLIARTNAPHVDWIGTSMGGIIGMLLAASSQSPIRRLVLNDVGPQISTKAIARLSTYVGQDPEFGSLAEAKAYYKSIYADFGKLTEVEWDKLTKHTVREIAPGVFAAKLDQRVKLGPNKSNLAWKFLFHPYKALEGTFFDIDLWPIWRRITCPVLVIRGQHSDLLLPETVAKMRQVHPRTAVIEIPNAGHAPALLHEDEHTLIDTWLSQP